MIKITKATYVGTAPTPGIYNEMVQDHLIPLCNKQISTDPLWDKETITIHHEGYIVTFYVTKKES